MKLKGAEVKVSGFAGTWKVLYRMPSRSPVIRKELLGKYAVMNSSGSIYYARREELSKSK